MHRTPQVWAGPRNTFVSHFSPSAKWVLGIELESSDLAARAFTTELSHLLSDFNQHSLPFKYFQLETPA